MAKGKSRENKASRWRELVNRQAGSGLSIREFCAKVGVSQPSFYAWRQRLQEVAGNGRRSAKSGDPVDKSAFIPLKLLDAAAMLEVVHPLGYQVRITGAVDTATLKRVLDVLDARGQA